MVFLIIPILIIIFSVFGIVFSICMNYYIFPYLGYEAMQISYLGGMGIVTGIALCYYIFFTKSLESNRFKVFLFGKK